MRFSWRLLPVILLGVLLDLLPAPSCGQCIVMEEFDPPGGPTGNNNTWSFVLCQSFTPEDSYVLDGVELYLSNQNVSEVGVFIQNSPTDSPTVIYSQTSFHDLLQGFRYVDLPDLSLIATFRYYIRVHATLEGGAYWAIEVQGGYAGGTAWVNGNAVSGDFLFRTCKSPVDRCDAQDAYEPSTWPGAMSPSQFVIAQSFRPSLNYGLEGVELLLVHHGLTSVTAFVQDDPTATPGQIFGQGTAQFPGPGFIYFGVGDIPLTSGTDYYIRIEGDTEWVFGDEPYVGGSAYVNGQLTANSFVFRTCSDLVAVEEWSWGAVKSCYR